MNIATTLCKSLRSLGLPQAKEHLIENVILKQLRSSGPEYVLSRISQLRDWRLQHITNHPEYKAAWFRSKKVIYRDDQISYNVPCDPIGGSIWNLSDKAVFGILGAISKGIELHYPSDKQLSKWITAVRNSGEVDTTYSDSDYVALAHVLQGVRVNFVNRAKHSSRYTKETIKHMQNIFFRVSDSVTSDVFNRKIYDKRTNDLCMNVMMLAHLHAQKVVERDLFSVSDITASIIPGNLNYVKINEFNGSKLPTDLIRGWSFSLSNAPLLTWQYLEDMYDILDHYQFDNEKGLFAYREVMQKMIKSAKGNSKNIDIAEGAYFTRHSPLMTMNFGMMAPVGRVGFIQQPGGKLRTVANPNRFVQYTLVPLGQVLSDAINRNSSVFVSNQKMGMKKCQEALNQGIPLASSDLSSATDTLNYQKITSLLKDVANHAISNIESNKDWMTEESPSYLYAKDITSELRLFIRTIEYFEDISQSPWVLPDNIVDKLDLPHCGVSWKTGQPLGLRPSFPLLTIQNAMMAERSRLDYNKDHPETRIPSNSWFCVGDDMVLRKDLLDYYVKQLAEHNGIINIEKTLVSDQYAEFCSHLITKNSILPLKPRLILGTLDGEFLNLQKFSTKGLKPRVRPWIRSLYNELASYYLDGNTKLMASTSSNPLPLNQRLALNTFCEYALIKPKKDLDQVSFNTLYYKATEILGKSEAFLQSISKPAYDKSSTFDEASQLAQNGLHPASAGDIVVKTWDYRYSAYIVKPNLVNDQKRLLRFLRNCSVDSTEHGVTISRDINNRLSFQYYMTPEKEHILEVRDRISNKSILVDPGDSILEKYKDISVPKIASKPSPINEL